MAETVKDERLKSLENKLKFVTSQKERLQKNVMYYQYYNQRYKTHFWRNMDLKDELDKQINCLRRMINFHRAWKELNPIMPVLGKIKAKMKFSDEEDKFTYRLQKIGDLFYLDYMLDHYTSHKDRFHYFNILKGYIIYDSEGNVYLSDYVTKDNACIETYIEEEFNNYQGVTKLWDGVQGGQFPVTVIDDKNLYITSKFEYIKLFHLTNKKFKLVNTFDDTTHIWTIPELWANQLLIINGSKIFDIKHGKNILSTNNGTIEYYDSYHPASFMNEIYSEYVKEYFNISDEIRKFLAENNVLLITDSFESSYEDIKEKYYTICFATMEGKIVGKALRISESNGKCSIYEIINNDYHETIKKLQDDAVNELKQIKKQKLINAGKFLTLMSKVFENEKNSINPTLNLNPNNKN